MEATPEPTPTEEAKPFSERTMAILAKIESVREEFRHLQDVSKEVQEIKSMMAGNETWRTAIWRAFKFLVTLIEPKEKHK